MHTPSASASAAEHSAYSRRAASHAVHTGRSWNSATRGVDAMDAKGDLWAVMAAAGVPLEGVTITPGAPDFYHPGRSGTVRQGPKTVLGTFGELHPRVLTMIGLAGPAVAFFS